MVVVAALCLIVGHPGPVLSNEHIHEGPAGMASVTDKEAPNTSDDNA